MSIISGNTRFARAGCVPYKVSDIPLAYPHPTLPCHDWHAIESRERERERTMRPTTDPFNTTIATVINIIIEKGERGGGLEGYINTEQ